MNQVTVLLTNRPRMLRESLCELIGREIDIEAIEVVPEPVEVLAAVARYKADVVVVTEEEGVEIPALCHHLLTQFPDLLVIALSSAEESGALYQRVITRRQLVPLSPSILLSHIRSQREEKLSPSSEKQS